MKNAIKVVMTLGVCVALSSAGWARDIAAGKAKVQQACATCHGLYGKSQMPMTPNLAGQVPDYMAHQLRGYKTGKRAHEVMSVIAKSLSDDDIDNVVAWYTSLKVTVEQPQ